MKEEEENLEGLMGNDEEVRLKGYIGDCSKLVVREVTVLAVA